MQELREEYLLISFKLFLKDKIEGEHTLVAKIDRHLGGVDKITDDIPHAVQVLCQKNGIDYEKVVKHAKEMFND